MKILVLVFYKMIYLTMDEMNIRTKFTYIIVLIVGFKKMSSTS